MKSPQHLLRALLTIPLCAVTAGAATFYWNGADNVTTSLNSAASYSTDPDTLIAPGAAPTATDDIVFNRNILNDQNFEAIAHMGAANRAYNSLTFVSSGTTQINRGSTDSGSSNNLSIGSHITVQAGAGAVSFGLPGSGTQLTQMRASGTTLSINNNSSSALTFNRNVGTSLGSGTATITVGGSGSGGIAFEDRILNNGTSASTALVVNRAGSGVVSLSSAGTAFTYSGGFTLTQGNVNANFASALGVGGVAVNGGTLALFGTGTGAITLGTGANFNLTGGTVNFDLGTAFDQITGTGAFSLSGGTLALNVGGIGFSYANTYQILSGFTGNTVTNLTINGYDSVNYVASLGDNGLLSFSAVPEPSSYAALAGFAALGLVALRRRRVTR
ncbi:MAG: PEP-CTERM sorting domain-containing protein [Opitutaceae bacterium]|nr:PEP-CTERM sorting domain-containing protein [Opitutaceae bacterium]